MTPSSDGGASDRGLVEVASSHIAGQRSLLERQKLEGELLKGFLERRKLRLDTRDVRWKVHTRWPALAFEVGKVLAPLFAVFLGVMTLLAQTSQFLEQQASELRYKTRQEVFETATRLANDAKADELPLRIMAARRLGSIGVLGMPFLLDQLNKREGLDNQLYVAILNGIESIITRETEGAGRGTADPTLQLVSGPLLFVAKIFGVESGRADLKLRDERDRLVEALGRFKGRVIREIGYEQPFDAVVRAYITTLSALGQARPGVLGDSERVTVIRREVASIMGDLATAIDKNSHASAQASLRGMRAVLESESARVARGLQ